MKTGKASIENSFWMAIVLFYQVKVHKSSILWPTSRSICSVLGHFHHQNYHKSSLSSSSIGTWFCRTHLSILLSAVYKYSIACFQNLRWSTSGQRAVNIWSCLFAPHGRMWFCRGLVNFYMVWCCQDGIVLYDVAGQGAVNIWSCLSIWPIHCKHCLPLYCMARCRLHGNTMVSYHW